MPEHQDPGRLLELIHSSPANYEYFFNNLDDPSWLDFLVRAGFFQHPPAPERDDDWIRYPVWPESAFLLRIAERAPNDVFSIVSRVPASDNPRVHEDIIEIATKLRPKLARQLARREAMWLRSYDGHLMLLPAEAGKLLAYLAEAHQTAAAFEFASALMRIRAAPDPATAPSRKRAEALMNEWSYDRIIKEAWPALVRNDALRALSFLADRLRDVIQIGFIDPSGFDTSSMWRAAIENHAQNLGRSLLDTVIDAVRDTALIVTNSDLGLASVIGVLEQYEGPLFRRLQLFVTGRASDTERVVEALTDPSAADDVALWHEYSELLRTWFGQLPASGRDAVLAVIALGPRWDDEASQQVASVEEKADRDRRARHWRLLRYSLIANDLPPAIRQSYDELVDEFGTPDHPDFLSYISTWSGPTSPLSRADLDEMSAAEIARFMREWKSGDRDRDPSSEGLSRIVEQVVADRPEEFARNSSSFVGADPDYVGAIVGGLENALKGRTPLEWSDVFPLLRWAVDQPREEPGEEPAANRWGWTRQRIASLLSRGFQEPTSMPLDSREQVWRLIDLLASDRDPTPAREESGDDGSRMDPFTLSINTVRGEAMHAVFRYVLWVERSLEDEFVGMASVPEAGELLDAHLDPAVDPSPAIRAVYGHWFAQLVRIDAEWARAMADRIFSPDEPRLFDAAWNTYIVWTPAWDDVFDVLAPTYRLAIDKTPKGPMSLFNPDDPQQQLGHHLFIFRIRGKIEETSDGQDLLTSFWNAASPETRQAVLTAVGHSLERTPIDGLTIDVQQRVKDVWGQILTWSEPSAAQELAGFGAWLGVDALDSKWLLKQAQTILDAGVHLDPDYVVYEALPRLADADPRAAVAVLRGMVNTDSEGWSLAGYEDEARSALAIVLKSADVEAHSDADALIESLGARGMRRFRDLKQ